MVHYGAIFSERFRTAAILRSESGERHHEAGCCGCRHCSTACSLDDRGAASTSSPATFSTTPKGRPYDRPRRRRFRARRRLLSRHQRRHGAPSGLYEQSSIGRHCQMPRRKLQLQRKSPWHVLASRWGGELALTAQHAQKPTKPADHQSQGDQARHRPSKKRPEAKRPSHFGGSRSSNSLSIDRFSHAQPALAIRPGPAKYAPSFPRASSVIEISA